MKKILKVDVPEGYHVLKPIKLGCYSIPGRPGFINADYTELHLPTEEELMDIIASKLNSVGIINNEGIYNAAMEILDILKGGK